ncbi:MAG: hypothetical protein JNL79_10595 [Myxococcales bacterium]|nr:hypothetical protein [Myxococcales bacterium]
MVAVAKEEEVLLHDWQGEWDALPSETRAALDVLASAGASEPPRAVDGE